MELLVRNIILGSVLVVLLSLELLQPYFEWKGKWKHLFHNTALIAVNAVFINILLVPLIIFSASFDFGLFHQLNLHWSVELILTILIIDVLMYILHVLHHKVPILWRFHRMHHSDTQMDFSTGARFHMGEHIVSILTRCVVYFVFGISLEFVAIFEIFFLANVFFHHANISLGKFDKWYRLIFTSPDMHKVHHSDYQPETDSNYTSLFSFWDRIFGTYKIVANPHKIVYGLKGFEEDQSVWRMLWTPFKRKHR